MIRYLDKVPSGESLLVSFTIFSTNAGYFFRFRMYFALFIAFIKRSNLMA
ncbi:MAG TPA: hypothetical protein PK855_02770 [Bacteroidales bacterium]|nr:hypothetical protein [Bacteroidales bacterium]